MRYILLSILIIAIAGLVLADEGDKPVKKIKIYIHTDLEGVSGVDAYEMMDQTTEGYQKARRLLMEDINAAVAGAFEGGADEVTVLDSHNGAHNFIPEMLDKRAVQDPRANKKWWGALDETYSGTFFIGAHAMAGTLNGFLDHTQSSTHWHDYSINGRKMGELAQWAIVAGNFGVPMLMVSGDEAACKEARDFFDPIETAVVKRGIGRNKAELVPLDEARARIREAAKKAISLIGKAKPFIPEKPMTIVLKYNRSDYCDSAVERLSYVERIDARTIRWVTSDPLAILPK
ncbi:MAG: M55 family metallopeptidase [Armatimonadota bacterium]|nr:M55 family metallopeptidase [Armatimonadota bacterium]